MFLAFIKKMSTQVCSSVVMFIDLYLFFKVLIGNNK